MSRRERRPRGRQERAASPQEIAQALRAQAKAPSPQEIPQDRTLRERAMQAADPTLYHCACCGARYCSECGWM